MRIANKQAMNRGFCLIYMVLYLSMVIMKTHGNNGDRYELLQLTETKHQMICMRYPLVIYQNCISRCIKRDLISFKEQHKKWLHDLLHRALTCSKHQENSVSCIVSRQRTKHYCEYTPPGFGGGIHRKQ